MRPEEISPAITLFSKEQVSHIYSLPYLLLARQVAWRNGGAMPQVSGCSGGRGAAAARGAGPGPAAGPYHQGAGNTAKKAGVRPGRAAGTSCQNPLPAKRLIVSREPQAGTAEPPEQLGQARRGPFVGARSAVLIPAPIATRYWALNSPRNRRPGTRSVIPLAQLF